MIHLYIGDGKGKTSAAAGLAIRMAGFNKRVLFAQFLKTDAGNEIKILKKFADVCHCYDCCKFLFNMNEGEKLKVKNDINTMFFEIDFSKYDLVVLDEILDCISENLISEAAVLSALPSSCEVVLTGRNASATLIEKADYVSRIEKIKHPFDEGVLAREGIEY